MKKCTKCGEMKPLSEFNKRHDMNDGYRSECRACLSIRNRERYEANADAARAKQREWNANNKDKKRKAAREWYLKNPEKVKESRERWANANPDKVKERIRRWAKNNPEKVAERARMWRERNPVVAREVNRRGSMKIWNSPAGRLSGILSSAIRRTLKGAKSRRHWEDIVGYSCEQLRAHIERQFHSGMTWENHGKVWEIDHIIPIKVFNFQDIDHQDFKRAWSLKNLQPLLVHENRRKSAKVSGPFQPSLAI